MINYFSVERANNSLSEWELLTFKEIRKNNRFFCIGMGCNLWCCIRKVEMNKLKDLSWDMDKHIQEEAIRYFSCDEKFDFNIVIKESPKNLMANLVEIIATKNFIEQFKFCDGLLFLLQDLSWPGSEKALSILKTFPKDILLPYLEKTLKEADKENDDNWIANLNILIKCHSFTKDDFSNIDLIQVLKKSAW